MAAVFYKLVQGQSFGPCINPCITRPPLRAAISKRVLHTALSLSLSSRVPFHPSPLPHFLNLSSPRSGTTPSFSRLLYASLHPKYLRPCAMPARHSSPLLLVRPLFPRSYFSRTIFLALANINFGTRATAKQRATFLHPCSRLEDLAKV